MKPITAALAVGAFCAAFGAVMFWPSGLSWPSGPKCDARDVLATVQNLANDRLSDRGRSNFLLQKGGWPKDKELINSLRSKGEALNIVFDSFRERGAEGKGVKCAAMATIMLGNERSFEFSTEYSVEPTTDGKVMVSARFTPN
jgi:hypothetical protein